jgi:hypothetical protein
MKKLPDQQTIQSLFDYKDGNLYWKSFQSPRAIAGSLAGSKMPHGYWRLGINKIYYNLHRIIWVYHNGDIADGLWIDHIDRNPSNNCIENLRLCTPTQNEYNKPRKGYRFEAGKWRAKIKINGRQKHIGMFDTEEEAKTAYDLAAQLIHGEYKHEVRA